MFSQFFLFPIMHLLNKMIWFSITIARSKIKQYDFLSQLREVIRGNRIISQDK